MDISDRLLFGQFLIEKKIINKSILGRAIEVQQKDNIAHHPRMLGIILLNDFGVFENRIQLNRCLEEFEIYQENIREMYLTAKIYGVSPEDKLDQEYAELMEELETAPTTRIRDLIGVIEKFKVAIKQIKLKDEEIRQLKEEITRLKSNSLKGYQNKINKK